MGGFTLPGILFGGSVSLAVLPLDLTKPEGSPKTALSPLNSIRVL